MPSHYSDPSRESLPHALPNVETFTMYLHECRTCGARKGIAPDYYGILYPELEQCDDCEAIGTLRCMDTKPGWYWWSCFPGCLPDSDPAGPFASEAEALADARDGIESDELTQEDIDFLAGD